MPQKGEKMSIIAISSDGPGLDSLVDPRFGRAGGFVLVDTESNTVSYLDNGLSQTMAQGAGIATVERLSEAGVDIVLRGYVGPKAFDALTEAEIRVCQDLDGMTVGEALNKFTSGDSSFADAPNKMA